MDKLIFTPDRISITWADGSRSEYHAEWLADNDPVNRDLRTGQRLIDVADLPEHPRIESARIVDDVMRVCWAGGGAAAYSLRWLCGYSRTHEQACAIRLWHASESAIARRFDYAEVQQSPDVRLAWLRTVASAGIAFLSGVPVELSMVLEVAALVGWVRETNYGRVFDVRAVPDPNNLAYTERALGLHTDNPYRDPVPGLQMLHCLCATSGGASLFVDGFAVADSLRLQDSQEFEILASTAVEFEFSDQTCHLSALRPIIQVNAAGDPRAVHYNSRSIAPIRLASDEVGEYYRAYRAFAKLLRNHQYILSTRLAEGDLVVFDNWRILHGRTEFETGSPRHLQGCYLDQDGLRSGMAILERQAEQSHGLR